MYSLRSGGVGPASDVGALGVIGGGGHRRVGPSLFGVVEAVVAVVGGRGGGGGGVRGAAGQDGAGQQGEDGAHPAHVEGEAEGHDALLVVGADGEPDGGNQAAESCRDKQSRQTGLNIEREGRGPKGEEHGGGKQSCQLR